MNFQSIIRNSVLAGAVTLLCAAPSWAVPVNITAQTTWFGTTIHVGSSNGSGAHIYKPLQGTLMGNLTDLGGGAYQLTDLMGIR